MPRIPTEWTPSRIDALSTAEVQQLRANAERLSRPQVVLWCNEVLGKRPGIRRKSAEKRAASAS
jgi:hypothetical protein